MGGLKLIRKLINRQRDGQLLMAGILLAVLVLVSFPTDLQGGVSRGPGAHQPAMGEDESLHADLPTDPPQPRDRRARTPSDFEEGRDTLSGAFLAEVTPGAMDAQSTDPVADSGGNEMIASIATHPLTPVDLDSDNDGVLDSRDRCPGTMSGLDVDQSGCLVMTQLRRRLILHVSYVPGTTAPDPLSLRILDDLAARLRRTTTLQVLVEGFTDNVGDQQANQRVSQKRANRIKAHLVRRGIPADRIDAIGRGESRFIASNDTAAGRQKNRRIEISSHRD